MSNRYPKNSNFNNIIVRNNGQGKITSDCVLTDTIYVKNLIVTDSLNLPVTNIDSLDNKDINKLIINKELKKIPKNSGKLIYNTELEDVMVEKNGEMKELSYNNLGNISNILQQRTNDVTQTIDNSFNKFTNIFQTIDFKGTQPPNTKNFILGSNNNINFLLDDSSFYLFEGYIVANIKNKVFSSFGNKEFGTSDNKKILLKRNKIYYSTYIIKNGLIKMQENDINNFETINLTNRICNNNFKLKKLFIGNKCYLAIETENLCKEYISWRAKINIVKINVSSSLKRTGSKLEYYILKNKPEKPLFNWNCYSLDSNLIFYKCDKQINFFNIPLYNLSKKNGEEIMNSIFFRGEFDNKILVKDDLGNETIQINNNRIAFNRENRTFYTLLSDNISLLVRDVQNNLDQNKPFAYKHDYYHHSLHSHSQKTNYIKSKGFWKSEEFKNKKFKQSQFFSTLDIDYTNHKFLNYVYLPKCLGNGKFDYFDYYLFSLNSSFRVNFVGDKIPEFKKSTFLLNENNDKHHFIYKDLRKLNNDFTEIYLSNRSVYDFQFGSINVIEGKCVIIDSDKNSSTFKKSKSFKIYADFFIPTYQDLRSDIINKLIEDKLSVNEIDSYLENAYLNKNFMKLKFIDIDNDEVFTPKFDDLNKSIDIVNTEKLFDDFTFKISLALRNINLTNLNNLDYAVISKELTKIKNFYLKVEVKSSMEKSYQVNFLFENNIFDIFSI